MDKKEVIELIKEVGYEQNGSMNSDGEYVEYCKGDEEYLFDNEDINVAYGVSHQAGIYYDSTSRYPGRRIRTCKYFTNDRRGICG